MRNTISQTKHEPELQSFPEIPLFHKVEPSATGASASSKSVPLKNQFAFPQRKLDGEAYHYITVYVCIDLSSPLQQQRRTL